MKIVCIWCAALVCLLLTSGPAEGETVSVSYTLDAVALESRGRLIHMKYYGEGGAIGLNDMVLFEDDAPGNGPPQGFDSKERAWFEKLSKGVVIRKELILDAPEAFGGYLLINGVERENNEHSIFINVNGVRFERPATKYAHPQAEHLYLVNENNYFTDNWFVIPIPAGALRAGGNEILLWTESEAPSWEVSIAADGEFRRGSTDRASHPNRSAKSRDGGRTWDDRKLGWKDALDGEYAIRLSLDRYSAAGTYVSPVFDLAETPGKADIKRRADIRRATVAWDINIPERTEAEVYVRLSASPAPGAEGWSRWIKVEGNRISWDRPQGRYFQFRVEMKTGLPVRTPLLNGVAVDAEAEIPSVDIPVMYRVVSFQNGRVVRSSFEFAHEDFETMRAFRKRFKLDELLEGCATEFEKQLTLLRFAYEIPIDRFDAYNWDYNNVPVLRMDEEGNIFRQQYTGRRRDLHCLYSNFTLMGACLAMGYPARYVNLQTEGRQHAHEVMEVWSNDFNKWVFMDATRDYCYYDPKTGIPLSLTEANERLAAVVPRIADWYDPIWKQIPDRRMLLKADIAYRQGDNEHSITEPRQGPHLLMLTGQLHQVTRNDFASRPELIPWRVSGHWGGNQFLGWYSEKFPRKREYGMHTSRRQDFNPALNQSELTVSETERPGVLRVDIDTETPCFDCFLVTIEKGKEIEVRNSFFEWPLHEGLNRLRVQTRNTAGALGPESEVRIIMNK